MSQIRVLIYCMATIYILLQTVFLLRLMSRCDEFFIVHSFFFIRTSNFDAEAERSYTFWRFEARYVLKDVLKDVLLIPGF